MSIQWRIQGRGPGGPPPPLIFRPNWCRPPPSQGLVKASPYLPPPPIPGSGESKPLPPRPPSQGLVKASPYLPPPSQGLVKASPYLPPHPRVWWKQAPISPPPIWRSGSATSIGYFILTTMLSIYILLCSSRYSDIWKIIPWSLLDIDQN